jgi:FAD/FMN-containing dehydrogenase
MGIYEELRGLREGMEVTGERERLREYILDFAKVKVFPHCAVFPENADDVIKIVKWANEKGVPLIPVSSGPPRIRGDSTPEIGGVIVDLRKMRKILRIDRRNRVCVVEAGVTFEELLPSLKKEGLRLNMPVSPRKNKSVLACFLEREPVMMPRYHWDASDPLLCLEVIFGTGDLFRTGEASGPFGLEEQWKIGGAQKFPLGPHQVDYFRIVQGAQGTMGIVTWASIKCEILPEIREFFFVSSDELKEKVLNFIYRLLRLDLVDELFILNDKNAETLYSDGISKGMRIPRWLVCLGIGSAGRFKEERMDYKISDLMDLAQSFGVKLSRSAGDIKGMEFCEKIYSPSEPYWKFRKGSFRDIFFITTLNRTPFFIKEFLNFLSECGYKGELGVYIQPLVQGTSCHLEFTLYSQRDDLDDIFERGSRFLFEKGAFFSRPYGIWSKLVYSRDSIFTESLKKVKRIFDPRGIMNPGKLCF